MKKIRRDAFADSHPIVNLIYFIFVIGFAMMSLHPVSLGIAFFGSGLIFYLPEWQTGTISESALYAAGCDIDGTH